MTKILVVFLFVVLMFGQFVAFHAKSVERTVVAAHVQTVHTFCDLPTCVTDAARTYSEVDIGTCDARCLSAYEAFE